MRKFMKSRAWTRVSRVAIVIAGMIASSIALAAEAPKKTTRIVVVGDSTASFYDISRYPRMGWGQVLGRFFDARVIVDDRAQSGRSARSFIEQGWFDGVAKVLSAGDVLLIQFGHNDAKIDDPTRYNDPETEFPRYLTRYLELARDKGATPVLITPVARRVFANGQPVDTHGVYAQAVRDLAAREHVALIDLSVLSMNWLRALGEEPAKRFYMHVPEQAQADDTHFQERGAEAIACLVAGGLVANRVPVTEYLSRDTDCGAPADALEQRAAQTHRSRVLREAEIGVSQPGPHGGLGPTTAYSFFADEPDLPMIVRKRVLHRGASIGLHFHKHDEVYYVISGRGEYWLDGQLFPVEAGMALLTRPGSTHAIRQTGDDALTLMIVYPNAAKH